MEQPTPLVHEYRGKVLDLTHYGHLCVVDAASRVRFAAGEPDTVVYYRSASKPLQALPVVQRRLDQQFGLSEEETVLFAGSHAGEEFHVAALRRILEKTGLTEDMLVMSPAAPAHPTANERRIQAGLPRRRLYHNCAGKHLALMLLQRALGAQVRDYWKPDAPAQEAVRRAVVQMSECDNMDEGVDGCGVPVFAVPLKGVATAFLNLAAPERIPDDSLRDAAARFVPRIHHHPLMMRGTGYLCSLLNEDPNIVAKGGANGVYGLALKKEKLGVAFKFTDGTEDGWPLVVLETLRGLGCLNEGTRRRLEDLSPRVIRNDNGALVGERRAAFGVSI